jgi:hypothetical protein
LKPNESSAHCVCWGEEHAVRETELWCVLDHAHFLVSSSFIFHCVHWNRLEFSPSN